MVTGICLCRVLLRAGFLFLWPLAHAELQLMLSCSGLARWIQLLWAPNSPMLFWASQCLALVSVMKKSNIDMYIYTHMDTHVLHFMFVYKYVFYFLSFSAETNKKVLLSAEELSCSFPSFIHSKMPLILLKFWLITGKMD